MLFALVALAAPAGADAHLRSGVVAVDYRASVVSPNPAVKARVYQSDRALGVTAEPGHTVVILGYLGEPFVRIGAGRVAVNAASLTAAGLGLLEGSHSGTGWRLRSRGETFVWHDRRLRALPAGVDRKRWAIPLVVDGHPAQLAGELERVERPPAWPWIVVGLPFVLVTALLLLRRRMSRVRTAAVALGVTSAVGMLATGAGFALDSYGSGGKWVAAANELVFVLVGIAFILRGSRHVKAIAGGALGFLGLGVGLSKIPVFLHGVVLSVVPGTIARLIVSVTISAGAAATALGLLVFEESFDRGPGEEPSKDETRLG
ncbi:MAG: hypothetical protein ACXVRK_12185 [Gaiellaceae bacterium]